MARKMAVIPMDMVQRFAAPSTQTELDTRKMLKQQYLSPELYSSAMNRSLNTKHREDRESGAKSVNVFDEEVDEHVTVVKPVIPDKPAPSRIPALASREEEDKTIDKALKLLVRLFEGGAVGANQKLRHPETGTVLPRSNIVRLVKYAFNLVPGAEDTASFARWLFKLRFFPMDIDNDKLRKHLTLNVTPAVTRSRSQAVASAQTTPKTPQWQTVKKRKS
jgi:hypothetical protein